MQDSKSYEEMFCQTLKIRLVEEEIIKRYPNDKIQSPVHLSIGQEAVAVGMCNALNDEDRLFSTYRSHAFYLAKGGNLNAMMAELYGKKTGCCGGKGGSMHLAAPDVGFMGTSAVVASSISNAVGSAFAAKLKNQSAIDVVVYGDGATEEGVYHESLNFASLHDLPIIFVCENNGYAVHSALSERQRYSIAKHAELYGIQTLIIEDGYDFEKIYQSFSTVVEHVRLKRQPYFVEIKTSRYKEHVGPGDDLEAGYRCAESVSDWQSKDPLLNNLELRAKFADSIAAEIEASCQYAESSPLPELADLYTDVI